MNPAGPEPVCVGTKDLEPNTMIPIRLVLTLGLSLLLQGAWPASASGPFQITLQNAAPFYQPVSAQVPAGTPIRWRNPTPTMHTITHDGCSLGPRCLFDSGPIEPNGGYTAPRLAPGRYDYHCEIHPFMQGVVIIHPSSPRPDLL